MILAAGYGERMRPLTDSCPKPLLKVGGRALIEYHLSALVKAGFTDIVINLSHLGHQIEQYLGDGGDYGVSIEYSRESSPLETAGGIAHALDLLGSPPFLVINGDIWCDYPLSQLPQQLVGLAHLILVDNPLHHPTGDFVLNEHGMVVEPVAKQPRMTFAGIGIYRPELFWQISESGSAPLAPLLRSAIKRGAVTGEYYRGEWLDIGTPERLHELDNRLKAGKGRL